MSLIFVFIPLIVAILSTLLLIYKELRRLNALIAKENASSEGKPMAIKKRRRSVRPTDRARKWLDTREGKEREAV